MKDIIERHFSASGLKINSGSLPTLHEFALFLLDWNSKMNLTAAKTLEELATYHLPDGIWSAALVQDLGVQSLVDVGSGNGIPGLVIPILVPGIRVTLVEPRLKKGFFLRQAAHHLGLDRVEVLECRAEDLPASEYAAAMSRATFRPPKWLALGQRIVKPGGMILTFISDGKALKRPKSDLELLRTVSYHLGPEERSRTINAYRKSEEP